MNYKNLSIKSSYETGEDDLLESFYIPVLENTVMYDRIAGFFSSSSLAVAARGIYGLIKNKGKMRILACPKMSKVDIKKILEITERNNVLENILMKEIEITEESLENDHVNALGWMLNYNYLEIKIAIPSMINEFTNQENFNGIFHQKVGILRDKDNNIISFSGSINESASGWLYNIEEFKVFKSWKDDQKMYLNSDINKFNKIWNNERANIKTYDLPKSVKLKLIESSNDFSLQSINIKKYKKYKELKKSLDELSLFYYQKNAIKKWQDNKYKLLFQMATGTGKTRTAIGCIIKLLNKSDKLLIIISCPQSTLSLQWKEEIDKFSLNIDKSIIIDGTNKSWSQDIEEIILKLDIGYYNSCIVFTTHITSSKDDFIQSLLSKSSKTEVLFVGDEVHGLGAFNMKKALLDIYDYRIGLSATPDRWFDEQGTEIIRNYFGKKSFEFTISDALSTINPLTRKPFLVNYYYFIRFIQLTDEEVLGYKKLSSDISKIYKMKKNSDGYSERFERLLFKRSNIIKNAENKYNELRQILLEEQVEDMIIFVSNDQIERVLQILNELDISSHRLTQNEGTLISQKYEGKTERQYIIDKFRRKEYKVLVAIKCLDEGIDIPSASKAILMASSTNPREYVQRIGRVIRPYKNKRVATIYDISIEPCYNRIKDEEIRMFEKKICEKEQIRLKDISMNALNNADALNIIRNKMGE